MSSNIKSSTMMPRQISEDEMDEQSLEGKSLEDERSTVSTNGGVIDKSCLNPKGEVRFPIKLHDMLMEIQTDEELSKIVSWNPEGTAFRVHKTKRFSAEILPQYFSHSKYRSFQRQLNHYGFERITKGLYEGGYEHPKFLREDPKKCRTIKRLKPLKREAVRPPKRTPAKASLATTHQDQDLNSTSTTAFENRALLASVSPEPSYGHGVDFPRAGEYHYGGLPPMRPLPLYQEARVVMPIPQSPPLVSPVYGQPMHSPAPHQESHYLPGQHVTYVYYVATSSDVRPPHGGASAYTTMSHPVFAGVHPHHPHPPPPPPHPRHHVVYGTPSPPDSYRPYPPAPPATVHHHPLPSREVVRPDPMVAEVVIPARRGMVLIDEDSRDHSVSFAPPAPYPIPRDRPAGAVSVDDSSRTPTARPESYSLENRRSASKIPPEGGQSWGDVLLKFLSDGDDNDDLISTLTEDSPKDNSVTPLCHSRNQGPCCCAAGAPTRADVVRVSSYEDRRSRPRMEEDYRHDDSFFDRTYVSDPDDVSGGGTGSNGVEELEFNNHWEQHGTTRSSRGNSSSSGSRVVAL